MSVCKKVLENERESVRVCVCEGGLERKRKRLFKGERQTFCKCEREKGTKRERVRKKERKEEKEL